MAVNTALCLCFQVGTGTFKLSRAGVLLGCLCVLPCAVLPLPGSEATVRGSTGTGHVAAPPGRLLADPQPGSPGSPLRAQRAEGHCYLRSTAMQPSFHPEPSVSAQKELPLGRRVCACIVFVVSLIAFGLSFATDGSHQAFRSRSKRLHYSCPRRRVESQCCPRWPARHTSPAASSSSRCKEGAARRVTRIHFRSASSELVAMGTLLPFLTLILSFAI